MACATDIEDELKTVAPYAKMHVFLVERNYRDLGCDRWTSQRVRRLCQKLNEPHEVMAARLRIRLYDFKRRMDSDCWTKQDGLILTIIEREVDFLKGGKTPAGQLVTTSEEAK